ncbi:MAG: PilT/PilU family type 4a pilus ATPase, partial [Oscillospiraceae bacterium]|nr:PilT/PilU family type 4a pilus ATPase [Oscillospiraceae bacterium]
AILRTLPDEPRGLILVTGPTGSGKSTTLAAMVDYINTNRACHILTVEDPVEYRYTQKKSLIHQRDVGSDVGSFADALRSAMREDPDVILVGEMRDYETISAAVTAAETGHLVLSTLHTTGAAMTVDRIIDVFPPHSQQQIRTQLASVLKGIVTQTLLPKAAGKGRVAAFEIMIGVDSVLNLIRENKGHQLNSTIQTGAKQGMVLLDMYLADLVAKGVVTREAALEKAGNKAEFLSAVGRY